MVCESTHVCKGANLQYSYQTSVRMSMCPLHGYHGISMQDILDSRRCSVVLPVLQNNYWPMARMTNDLHLKLGNAREPLSQRIHACVCCTKPLMVLLNLIGSLPTFHIQQYLPDLFMVKLTTIAICDWLWRSHIATKLASYKTDIHFLQNMYNQPASLDPCRHSNNFYNQPIILSYSIIICLQLS